MLRRKDKNEHDQIESVYGQAGRRMKRRKDGETRGEENE